MGKLIKEITKVIEKENIPERVKIDLWKNIFEILRETEKKIDELEAFKIHLVGAWVTDRPDIIPKDLIDPYFWEIK